MPSNARPGENPADIIDGVRKRKASERSTLANDLTPVEPKKAKVTTTGKNKPVAKKAATIAAKSAEFLKKAFTGPKKSCKFSL